MGLGLRYPYIDVIQTILSIILYMYIFFNRY